MSQKTEERLEKILTYLKENGHTTTATLADIYRVSLSTMKRDLSILEERQRISRVYGGAIAMNDLYVAPVAKRSTEFPEEKTRIAQAAANLISRGDSILIEGGSTCYELYKSITADNVSVFLLNVPSLFFRNPHISHMYVLSGEVFPENGNIGGSLAVEALSIISPRLIFFSTAAISDDLCILCEDDSSRTMAKSIFQMSGTKILMVNSQKFGLSKNFIGHSIDGVDILITDSGINPQIAEAIQSLGVKLIVV